MDSVVVGILIACWVLVMLPAVVLPLLPVPRADIAARRVTWSGSERKATGSPAAPAAA